MTVSLDLCYTKKNKSFTLPRLEVPLADTHAHLMSFWGADPVGALARAAVAGVTHMVTLWDPLADNKPAPTSSAYHDLLVGWTAQARAAVEEALDEGAVDVPGVALELFDNVRFLSGVHPYGAPEYTDAVHAQVMAALDDPLCVGVGEVGLDYHFDADDNIEAAPHDMQMDVMARQVALACERNVPVELHLRNDNGDEAREAHADAYRVLREVGVPSAGCVLHCFGEDRATMERFVELGCSITFGGAATFKRNDAVREAFAACPLDRLLLETDCPYMAPEPIRGLECEPAMIAQTARLLAADRCDQVGTLPAETLRAAHDNACRMFYSKG